MKQQKTTKIMVTCALLVALQVILARFLSINTTFVVVNFSFLAVALAGILFGPLWGMAVGASLFPFGAFFPGFTLTAALVGLVYGAFLHTKTGDLQGKSGWLRVVGASLSASLIRFVLNSVWLYIMYGAGLFGMLPARITETVCMVVAQLILLPVLSSMVRRLVHRGWSLA